MQNAYLMAAAVLVAYALGAADVIDAAIEQYSGIDMEPNIRAFLKMIRVGEGTADAGGYTRLVGGGTFYDFSDHPRTLVHVRAGLDSTAAGAYQFLVGTWDEVARKLGLSDFSPASQDLAAVQKLKDRGAYADVVAGRINAALSKVSYEWASLPPFRYGGQGTMTNTKARAVFLAAGGSLNDGSIFA